MGQIKFKKGDKVILKRISNLQPPLAANRDNKPAIIIADEDIKGMCRDYTVKCDNDGVELSVWVKEMELVKNQFNNNQQTKPTNPKDSLGIQKVGTHCIPMQPFLEVGLAMTEGARKYGAHNYRKDGVRFSVYFDAALRHIISWWEGENIDPDSDVHHLIKAIACLFVVRDSMLMGNCVDDRPLRYPNGLEIEKLNKIAAELIQKYPKCKESFTEQDK